MQTLVVYDSKSGNTRKLAEMMANAVRPHCEVRLSSLDQVDELGHIDLLIIGGPTERHGISARMGELIDRLQGREGDGLVAATFDTRYRMPDLISGSAAKVIARRLERSGIHVFIHPESFFVTRDPTPALETGEAERAAAWANKVATRCFLSSWCAA